MSNIVFIKSQFWNDEKIACLTTRARLLLIGMMNFVDQDNCIPPSTFNLKIKIFPGDDLPLEDIQKMVKELLDDGLLENRERDNKSYWRVADSVSAMFELEEINTEEEK